MSISRESFDDKDWSTADCLKTVVREGTYHILLKFKDQSEPELIDLETVLRNINIHQLEKRLKKHKITLPKEFEYYAAELLNDEPDLHKGWIAAIRAKFPEDCYIVGPILSESLLVALKSVDKSLEDAYEAFTTLKVATCYSKQYNLALSSYAEYLDQRVEDRGICPPLPDRCNGGYLFNENTPKQSTAPELYLKVCVVKVKKNLISIVENSGITLNYMYKFHGLASSVVLKPLHGDLQWLQAQRKLVSEIMQGFITSCIVEPGDWTVLGYLEKYKISTILLGNMPDGDERINFAPLLTVVFSGRADEWSHFLSGCEIHPPLVALFHRLTDFMKEFSAQSSIYTNFSLYTAIAAIYLMVWKGGSLKPFTCIARAFHGLQEYTGFLLRSEETNRKELLLMQKIFPLLVRLCQAVIPYLPEPSTISDVPGIKSIIADLVIIERATIKSSPLCSLHDDFKLFHEKYALELSSRLKAIKMQVLALDSKLQQIEKSSDEDSPNSAPIVESPDAPSSPAVIKPGKTKSRAGNFVKYGNCALNPVASTIVQSFQAGQGDLYGCEHCGKTIPARETCLFMSCKSGCSAHYHRGCWRHHVKRKMPEYMIFCWKQDCSARLTCWKVLEDKKVLKDVSNNHPAPFRAKIKHFEDLSPERAVNLEEKKSPTPSTSNLPPKPKTHNAQEYAQWKRKVQQATAQASSTRPDCALKKFKEKDYEKFLCDVRLIVAKEEKEELVTTVPHPAANLELIVARHLKKISKPVTYNLYTFLSLSSSQSI